MAVRLSVAFPAIIVFMYFVAPSEQNLNTNSVLYNASIADIEERNLDSNVELHKVTNPKKRIFIYQRNSSCSFIHIYKNKIYDIHGIIEENVNSQRLELENMNIIYLRSDIFVGNKKLTFLIMGNNPLVIDPDQIWITHPTIKYLDLSDCDLPPLNLIVFKGLPSLKLVNLSGNPGCHETRLQVLHTHSKFKIKCDI